MLSTASQVSLIAGFFGGWSDSLLLEINHLWFADETIIFCYNECE